MALILKMSHEALAEKGWLHPKRGKFLVPICGQEVELAPYTLLSFVGKLPPDQVATFERAILNLGRRKKIPISVFKQEDIAEIKEYWAKRKAADLQAEAKGRNKGLVGVKTGEVAVGAPDPTMLEMVESGVVDPDTAATLLEGGETKAKPDVPSASKIMNSTKTELAEMLEAHGKITVDPTTGKDLKRDEMREACMVLFGHRAG